jgi:hypothetical protein
MAHSAETLYPARVIAADRGARPDRFLAPVTVVAALVTVLALLAFGLALRSMPQRHWSWWGSNALGGADYARALWGEVPRHSEGELLARMRLWLVVAWIGYGAALVGARLGGGPSLATVRVAVAVAALGLAVMIPPALSCDVHAYVAYARMWILHGIDPHARSQLVLRSLGDPIAPFLQWDLPSPYGPLWTAISIGVVAPLKSAPVFVQVLAFKLLAAGALIGLAVLGGAMAEALSPGRGTVATLAIGFNPLLIVEGPGSGHNDLLMLLALLGGLALVSRGRSSAGAAVVGLSIAIKLVALLVVPWLILLRLRELGPLRKRLIGALVSAAAAVAPLLLLALAWGRGALPAALAAHLSAHSAAGTVSTAIARGALVLLFMCSCLWIFRRACVPALVSAWIALSSAFILLGFDVWYPWYFTWPLVFALLRWNGVALGFVIATNTLALTVMSLYARLK